MTVDMNENVEGFTHDLVIAIYDLNKKHNDVLHRTTLGNSMIELFRYINIIKENKKEKCRRTNTKP